jgi:hypothetical protein
MSFNIFYFHKIKNNFFFSNFKFNILKNFENLLKIGILFAINTNIRLLAPSLHLILRKATKNFDTIVVSIGNVDTLLFKHILISNITSFLNSLILGKTWFCNFLNKKKTIAYTFNIDFLNSSHSNLFKIIKNFKFKEILYYEINLKQNLALFALNYFYHLSTNANSNYLVNDDFNSKIILSKKMIYKTTFYKNLFSENLFLFSNLENKNITYISKFFSLDFFSLKKNIFLLLEISINKTKIDNWWDLIFPINSITENFLIYKNFTNNYTKSLFLKSGPWFS